MNKRISLFFILLSNTWPLFADQTPFEQIKFEIEAIQKKIVECRSEQEKSKCYFELAVRFYHDQEVDRAFEYFLEALRLSPKDSSYEMEEKERVLYSEALERYIVRGTDPVRGAEKLIQDFGEIANQNPEFLHLNFLIASAYANLGDYAEFFEKFYRGYPYLHDTFLAYKTRGILYLRLAAHLHDLERRKRWQAYAESLLTQALEKNVLDAGLYKVLIFLAKEENEESKILFYLQKMVEQKVTFARNDIYLYVKEAIALKEFHLGQEIIDRGKDLYDYSRSLSAAQEYLNQNRG